MTKHLAYTTLVTGSLVSFVMFFASFGDHGHRSRESLFISRDSPNDALDINTNKIIHN
tara:strand:+ start:330 stop:503 length:174 start_codon:yes stop_codon:yes gene_type:complete